MKRRSFVLASALAVALSAALDLTFQARAQSTSNLTELERRTIEVFEKASVSVVHIAARKGAADVVSTEEKTNANIQTGSGFIWDTLGHIVTNDHVISGTTAVSVRLAHGEVVRATVVGLAPTYDLAVLKLVNPKQLPPPLAIGTSADLKVGQFTYAIGNPFGLDQTLTTGVISALKRRLPTRRGRELANVIQTDAAINPGNSGGPLLDSGGKLIGVNTAIYSPSGGNAGIGFSIPADIVSRVVPDLIKNGRVPQPAVGIVPAAQSVATRLGIEGIIVMRVVPNSPASRAGVKGVDTNAGTVGDVILKVGGKSVTRIPDLTDELERIGVGGKVELTLKREDKEVSVELEVVDSGMNRPGATPPPAPPPAAPPTARAPNTPPPSSQPNSEGGEATMSTR
jgi:S1-C subfamily serine protease